MPRAPMTLKRSRGLSKEGSTGSAPAQSAYLDEQPPLEMDTIRPADDEIVNVLNRVLDILKDSTIASKTDKDDRSRFWEHDDEFLEQYNSDMDIVLIFSCLFSTVSTAFIVAMESNLSPDPNDTTHALLAQLVQIGLGNFAAAGSIPAAPASTWSPSTANIRIQSIAYASLSFSTGRDSEDERGKRRQEKFDGIVTWYFDAVVQSFPILLQFSLFLFGIALGANMWYEQYTVAWVIIAATVFGFLFYSLTVMAALVSPACPFQTPISTILRILRVDGKIILKFCSFQSESKLQSSYVQLLFRPSSILSNRCMLLFGAFQYPLPWRRSPTRVVDSEAQSLDQSRNVVSMNQCLLKLKLPDTPTSSLEAPSIKWLLETSTDPEVFLAAASLVHQCRLASGSQCLRHAGSTYTIFTTPA
ncbi:uncharacterized protein BJ212DRAFT_1301551 [Suillus subaureus]|uniref:DUF6535 domain-containing protein n=1 Tax=Suillus subaureus TaxID=48587 RepID=A0A9P7E6D0_9AGAM|nr:uncharacterized protein BJ212DRAFT_1301551 [Suillus subaureus]KAG1812583.1 hypothetical protein BJ212DRAFT_1301551 [Suillus subaureus]